MDMRTGEIASLDDLRKQLGEEAVTTYVKPVDTSLLPLVKRLELAQTSRTKVGRNDPCPCGSQKKFKHCCRMDAR